MPNLALPVGLAGERGLLLAIIRQAVIDYQRGTRSQRQSAAVYFASDAYRAHLVWLGLPPEWLPLGVSGVHLQRPAGIGAGIPKKT